MTENQKLVVWLRGFSGKKVVFSGHYHWFEMPEDIDPPFDLKLDELYRMLEKGDITRISIDTLGFVEAKPQ